MNGTDVELTDLPTELHNAQPCIHNAPTAIQHSALWPLRSTASLAWLRRWNAGLPPPILACSQPALITKMWRKCNKPMNLLIGVLTFALTAVALYGAYQGLKLAGISNLLSHLQYTAAYRADCRDSDMTNSSSADDCAAALEKPLLPAEVLLPMVQPRENRSGDRYLGMVLSKFISEHMEIAVFSILLVLFTLVVAGIGLSRGLVVDYAYSTSAIANTQECKQYSAKGGYNESHLIGETLHVTQQDQPAQRLSQPIKHFVEIDDVGSTRFYRFQDRELMSETGAWLDVPRVENLPDGRQQAKESDRANSASGIDVPHDKAHRSMRRRTGMHQNEDTMPIWSEHKVRHKSFFVPGRVFHGRWVTPRSGDPIHDAYIQRRPMVVVSQHKVHCLCVPINSDSNQGVGKKGLTDAQAKQHAIVYTQDSQPQVVEGDDQKADLMKPPFQVLAPKIVSLSPASRLRFDSIDTFQYNRPVGNIGMIEEKDVKRLIGYVQAALLSDTKDD